MDVNNIVNSIRNVIVDSKYIGLPHVIVKIRLAGDMADMLEEQQNIIEEQKSRIKDLEQSYGVTSTDDK